MCFTPQNTKSRSSVVHDATTRSDSRPQLSLHLHGGAEVGGRDAFCRQAAGGRMFAGPRQWQWRWRVQEQRELPEVDIKTARGRAGCGERGRESRRAGPRSSVSVPKRVVLSPPGSRSEEGRGALEGSVGARGRLSWERGPLVIPAWSSEKP